MKKLLFSAVFSTVVLVAAHQAMATPIPIIHGAVTISWTIDQQKTLDVLKYGEDGKTSISGPANNRTTNVLEVTTSSISTAPFNDVNFLDLLENSLDQTFPTGAKLVTDGTILYVADHTGTNAIVEPTLLSSILTVTHTNNITAGLETAMEAFTKAGSSGTANGTSSGSEFVIVNYDDSTQVTKDGTTSVFQFAGVSTFTRSASEKRSTNDIATIKESGSFKVTGSGTGTIRGTNSIIAGTILGTPAGTETIDLTGLE